MRIALISYEFPPETLGGIGTYAGQAARMLAERGHDLTVFSATSATLAFEENLHGARVHRLPCKDRRSFFLPAVDALVAEHRRAPFEIAEVPDLYAEGRGLRTALPELPILLRAHTPVYIPTEIDFNASPLSTRWLSALRVALGGLAKLRAPASVFRGARARIFFRASYNYTRDAERTVALEADLVAPPSLRLAQRLRDDWRLPAEKIRVLPYSHRPDSKLLALPPPTAAKVIGFHGGIKRFKGVHVLLSAFRLVLARHPDARLILAGASGGSSVHDCSWSAWKQDRMVVWRDTLKWLKPQIDALGDRVILRGFVRPEHLYTHLAESDVCVFPSLFDNFPSACLEAMAAARPIVATRSGGMEEMLGRDEAGLLIPPGDIRALADALCRLMEEVPLRNQLALRARERLLVDYSPDTVGPRHEALYVEAIARRHLGHPTSIACDFRR